jgi:hypothetical protein
MKKKLMFSVLPLMFLLVFTGCKDAKDEAEAEVKIEKTYEERVKEVETSIRNSAEWMASVEKKAKEKNIPLDSMIALDARWLVDEQDGKHKDPGTTAVAPAAGNDANFEQLVKDMEEKIRNDKVWLESIERKAKERNITVDSMIKVDARFIVTEQQKNKQ